LTEVLQLQMISINDRFTSTVLGMVVVELSFI